MTISGAITEVVYALGAEGQLVGTDTTSLFPAAAQKTPKVGYLRQLSAEGILSLKPDAVIATSEAGPPVVLDQLRLFHDKVNQLRIMISMDITGDNFRTRTLLSEILILLGKRLHPRFLVS